MQASSSVIKLFVAIIAVIFFAGLSVSANNEQTDSLLLLTQAHQPDSVRIAALTELGRLTRMSNTTLAREYYLQADSLAKLSGTYLQQIKIYAGLGRLEAIAGNQAEALQYFNLSLEKSKEGGVRNEEAENYVNLGIMHKRIGNYPQSQKHYLEALNIFTELDDKAGLSRTYQNLGVVTDLSHQLDKAMEYYQIALQLEQESGKTDDLASIYNNMAIVEYKKQNLPQAIDMMKTVLYYNKKDNNPTGLLVSYMNIGSFYITDKKYTMALAYLDSVLTIIEQYPDKQSEINLYFNYSQAWLELGNLDRALEYSKRNLDLAKELGSFKLLAEAWSNSAKVLESKGDYQTALIHYRNYKLYNDSLYNQERNREMANYQVQLDVFSKTQLIADQQIEMLTMNQAMMRERRLRWLFFIIAVLSLTVVYLIVQKFMRSRKVNRKLEQQNQIITDQKARIEATNQQLEQRLLRSQLNPHFVFNALSSIQHLITQGDKAPALGYLSRFSRLLRQILDSSVESTVLLSEEIKMLKAYIDLEALRFGNQFEYSLDIDPEIDPHSYEVPALLVQPVIENAIIHGLLPSERKKMLKISFLPKDDTICCIVEDNGVGRKKSAKKQQNTPFPHKSHGLNITRQRITNKMDGEPDQTMIYTDLLDENGAPNGTRVQITIPVTI
jgi:tetratricopeptide (TPR) repeat protein